MIHAHRDGVLRGVCFREISRGDEIRDGFHDDVLHRGDFRGGELHRDDFRDDGLHRDGFRVDEHLNGGFHEDVSQIDDYGLMDVRLLYKKQLVFQDG